MRLEARPQQESGHVKDLKQLAISGKEEAKVVEGKKENTEQMQEPDRG